MTYVDGSRTISEKQCIHAYSISMLLYFGDAEFVTLKTGRIQCHALSRTFLYAARGKQEPLNDVTPVHGLARSLECVCSWP